MSNKLKISKRPNIKGDDGYKVFSVRIKDETVNRQRYNGILSRADSIEIVSPRYTSECMLERNLRLAQLADLCICFFDEKRASSGTGQTLRFMKNNNIPIENMFI